MGSTKFYLAFMDKARNAGEDLFYAAQSEEAAEAHAQDQKVDHDETRTRTHWPTKLDYFESRGEFQVAMQDEAYKLNPAYRAKVHQMLANSASEVTGVSISSGESTDPNQLTDAMMIESSRREAMRAETSRLFREAGSDPVKRWELNLAMANENNREMIEQAEKDLTGEGALSRAFRLSKRGATGSDLNKAMASENGDGINPNNAPAQA